MHSWNSLHFRKKKNRVATASNHFISTNSQSSQFTSAVTFQFCCKPTSLFIWDNPPFLFFFFFMLNEVECLFVGRQQFSFITSNVSIRFSRFSGPGFFFAVNCIYFFFRFFYFYSTFIFSHSINFFVALVFCLFACWSFLCIIKRYLRLC